MRRTRIIQNALVACAAAAVCGAVGLITVAARTTPDRTNDPAQVHAYIEQAEKDWVKAVVSGNTAVVEQALADDFVGVGPDGKSFGKPTMIKLIEAAPQEYIRNHVDQMTIKVFDKSAYVTGSESWERRTQEPKTGRFVWHNTWVDRDGQWKIVANSFFVIPTATYE